MENFNNLVKKILLNESPFFVENELSINLNKKSTIEQKKKHLIWKKILNNIGLWVVI